MQRAQWIQETRRGRSASRTRLSWRMSAHRRWSDRWRQDRHYCRGAHEGSRNGRPQPRSLGWGWVGGCERGRGESWIGIGNGCGCGRVEVLARVSGCLELGFGIGGTNRD